MSFKSFKENVSVRKDDVIQIRIESAKKDKFVRACTKLRTEMSDSLTKHIDATIRMAKVK